MVKHKQLTLECLQTYEIYNLFETWVSEHSQVTEDSLQNHPPFPFLFQPRKNPSIIS